MDYNIIDLGAEMCLGEPFEIRRREKGDFTKYLQKFPFNKLIPETLETHFQFFDGKEESYSIANSDTQMTFSYVGDVHPRYSSVVKAASGALVRLEMGLNVLGVSKEILRPIKKSLKEKYGGPSKIGAVLHAEILDDYQHTQAYRMDIEFLKDGRREGFLSTLYRDSEEAIKSLQAMRAGEYTKVDID